MANTLKFGGGTWATKEGSTLAYNDENENYKPLPFNFERDSIATRVNKEGLIEVVGNDIPRIDYTDSADGVLLLEEGSSNRVPWSEDINNSAWAKIAVTVDANQIISPDGTQNADLITETTANSQHRISDIVTLSTGVEHTISAWVKPNGTKYVRLRIENAAVGSGQVDVYFDMENLLPSLSNGSIKKYSNGWYRLSATGTPNNAASVAIVGLAPDLGLSSYVGDGVSGAYVWGIQVEQSSYATSYIPTSGSTVQRASETANGSGNSEVFNDSEGVLFADIAGLVNDNNFKAISVSESNVDNRITLSLYQGSLFAYIADGGVGQFNVSQSVGSVLEFHKTAIKYKANDCAFWIDGFEVAINTSPTTMPSGLKELAFDKGNGADDFYGKTKELGYYDTILTDEELEYITSYRSLNELVTELNLNTL